MPLVMKCQVLDIDGRRCRRDVVTSVAVLGDPKLRKRQPDYVLVHVCAKHMFTGKRAK